MLLEGGQVLPGLGELALLHALLLVPAPALLLVVQGYLEREGSLWQNNCLVLAF